MTTHQVAASAAVWKVRRTRALIKPTVLTNDQRWLVKGQKSQQLTVEEHLF